MANKITNTDNYTAIANAIRAKNGSSDTYTPSQMATAISNIPTGTGLPVNTKFAYTKPSIINQIFYTDEYDTSAYTDMSHMFDSCFAEEESGQLTLNLSKLDTSNVTNMDSMFKNNTYLKDWSTVGLTNFDTSNVTAMGAMFQGCKQGGNVSTAVAEVIDLSGFDFSNVTHTTYMFKDAIAGGITWPSNIDTSSLIGAYQMFYGFATQSLDLSDFDFSSLEYADQMFATSQMPSLTMNGCDFTSMSSGHAEFKRFFYNSMIPTITLRNWELKDGAVLGGGTSSDGMFSGCSYTTTIDMSGWTHQSIDDTRYMFYKCTSLSTLDISGLDLTKITNYSNMFGGSSSSYRVPYGCLIYVKDQDSKDWMTSHFSSYTNVQIKQSGE